MDPLYPRMKTLPMPGFWGHQCWEFLTVMAFLCTPVSPGTVLMEWAFITFGYPESVHHTISIQRDPSPWSLATLAWIPGPDFETHLSHPDDDTKMQKQYSKQKWQFLIQWARGNGSLARKFLRCGHGYVSANLGSCNFFSTCFLNLPSFLLEIEYHSNDSLFCPS